jgi:molybdopterin synthase sulfur carrier subunit
VKVHVHATLRQIVGGRAAEASFTPGETVHGLLDQLVARYPPLQPALFDEAGDLFRHVHVLVNGRDVRYLEAGLDTVLAETDAIDLFPPVAGGTEGAAEVGSFEVTVTAVPLWLLRSYLEELGGWRSGERAVQGDGWLARLEQVEDHQVGSLRVGRVRIALEGSPAALAALQPALEKRLIRGGG